MFDINTPFAMVVAIVAIAAGAKIWRTHLLTKSSSGRSNEDQARFVAMEKEVLDLRQRVSVLERLVIDEDRRLASEINSLRDSGGDRAHT